MITAPKRDRRKPVTVHPCVPINRAFTYYRDTDGAIRPKLPPQPDPRDPIAVLRFLLEVDHLGTGPEGKGRYNPRISLGGFRVLIEEAIACAD